MKSSENSKGNFNESSSNFEYNPVLKTENNETETVVKN